jgi:hypothetical protein
VLDRNDCSCVVDNLDASPFPSSRSFCEAGCSVPGSPAVVSYSSHRSPEVGEAPLRETRRLLDRVAQRIGWTAGEIRHRIFRHTFCAARLMTLDGGAPVSLYMVSREMGHGSEDLVRRVYSHLGAARHRSEVVEYRVEQHFERLGDQLRRLGFVITPDIKRGAEVDTENPASTEVPTGKVLPEWARRDSNARPLAPEASALSN